MSYNCQVPGWRNSSAALPVPRIAVVGDFFLDKYLEVDPNLVELSLETGKRAHQVVDIRCSPGAAGTVVCNLSALGTGQLHAVGFTGDDGEGFDLRKELARLGCSTNHLQVAANRRTPTYLKPRDTNAASLAAEHSRYDTKNRSVTPADLEQAVIASLDQLLPCTDAVIVLDQVEEADCGVVTGRVRSMLADRARGHRQVVFWADSRRRIRHFSDVIIKPNQFEAVGNEDPRPGDVVALEDLVAAAGKLRDEESGPGGGDLRRVGNGSQRSAMDLHSRHPYRRRNRPDGCRRQRHSRRGIGTLCRSHIA